MTEPMIEMHCYTVACTTSYRHRGL